MSAPTPLTTTNPPTTAPSSRKLVGVADFAVSADSASELVTQSLGSCLGVTAYDPVSKIGGMVNVMLPDSKIHTARASLKPCMFVDTGVACLMESLTKLGGDPSRVVVKIAGGAQFLNGQDSFNIGERNVEALDAWMARAGRTAEARDIGGTHSRTMRLNLATGTVSILSPGSKPYTL